jgi:hypothetical protein
MLTTEQLHTRLSQSPAPRVTPEYMQSRIASYTFTNLPGHVTLCQIFLDNGYCVMGEAAVVNKDNYDKDIGEKIAYEKAFAKLWPLFGFALAEYNFAAQSHLAETDNSTHDLQPESDQAAA